MGAASALVSCRAAITGIAALVYLAIASAPCPQTRPDAVRGEPAHAAAAHVHDDTPAGGHSASIAAPCLCGCERSAAWSGLAKLGPAVLPHPPAVLLGHPRPAPREDAQRLPDAPISLDSPVPIAT